MYQKYLRQTRVYITIFNDCTFLELTGTTKHLRQLLGGEYYIGFKTISQQSDGCGSNKYTNVARQIYLCDVSEPNYLPPIHTSCTYLPHLGTYLMNVFIAFLRQWYGSSGSVILAADPRQTINASRQRVATIWNHNNVISMWLPQRISSRRLQDRLLTAYYRMIITVM